MVCKKVGRKRKKGEGERGRGGGKMGYVFGCRIVPRIPKGKKGGKGKPRDVVFSSLGAFLLLLLSLLSLLLSDSEIF